MVPPLDARDRRRLKFEVLQFPRIAMLEESAAVPSASVRSVDDHSYHPPRCPDALQQNAGGLVIRVLRHQFAADRLGEDGLVETACNSPIGRMVAVDTVDLVKGFFDRLSPF